MHGIASWRQFEDLVRRILEANNFSLQYHLPRGDSGFDFIGEKTREVWAIEVKYYRTARAQPTLLETAATRLVNNALAVKAARHGMLVVSCELPPALKESMEERFSLTLVDRNDLRILASASAQLAEELDALVESDPGAPSNNPTTKSDPTSRSKPLQTTPSAMTDSKGTGLRSKLNEIKRGKKDWARYEILCTEILQYLFPNDLHGWHKQKRTDDGLNRFDFVCRVRPTTEFWKFLIDHLNSRYIVFEFKNYSGKIKQGQILTTEKYLHGHGLRKAAIIFNRVGAEPHAIAMTQGAMREHGKLMLLVDDNKVCEMLHRKERGEDPTDILFELADDFLLKLPR